MAKLTKYQLAMADGPKARSIEEVREHSDVASIATYFEDGRLQRWLLANYLDDEAKKVGEIKELFDSENKKLKVQNIHKLYESLELGKVDEKEIYAYLENQPEVKTNTVCFEVEDDSSVKEELKKHIYPDTKLEDWSISFEEVDETTRFVELQNKVLDLYTSYKLKNDNSFYNRISYLIYQMEKTASITFYDIICMKEKIEATKSIDDVIKFGKYKWNVIRKDEKQAFLLCSQIITTMNWFPDGSHILDWLNTTFIEDSFSASEISLILDSNEKKVFIPSVEDILPLVAKDRLRKLNGEKYPSNWWLDCAAIVNNQGGIVKGANTSNMFGIVPAIIVKSGI